MKRNFYTWIPIVGLMISRKDQMSSKKENIAVNFQIFSLYAIATILYMFLMG